MRAFSSIIVAAAFLAVPALASAEEAQFEILETEFQGNCGAVDPIINTQSGEPSIDILFPELSVSADEQNRRQRKLCNVRIKLRIDDGYRLSLTEMFYEGRVDIDTDGGSGNVSARAYLQGRRSLHGFKNFGAGAAENFTVHVDQGPAPTQCGGETYLNLLVDLTARTAPGHGQFADIAIQRGAGTPGPAHYRARVQCGMQQDQCH